MNYSFGVCLPKSGDKKNADYTALLGKREKRCRLQTASAAKRANLVFFEIDT
ncbi:MAG: hypothetical protein Q4E16_02185 [Neisseria sp.]|nr:hypothetical protein [Neisseria sp.]